MIATSSTLPTDNCCSAAGWGVDAGEVCVFCCSWLPAVVRAACTTNNVRTAAAAGPVVGTAACLPNTPLCSPSRPFLPRQPH